MFNLAIIFFDYSPIQNMKIPVLAFFQHQGEIDLVNVYELVHVQVE